MADQISGTCSEGFYNACDTHTKQFPNRQLGLDSETSEQAASLFHSVSIPCQLVKEILVWRNGHFARSWPDSAPALYENARHRWSVAMLQV
jgi:hypothetical protein